jgi:signal transduction histidine kinase
MSGQHKEILRLVNESANNLRHILDDVLDLSKLEAGKLRLVEQTFVLGEMLDAVIAPLLPRAAEKGISLHLATAPDLPHVISADQARVTQILTNLIRHAISLSSGGSVVIAVRAIQRSALRMQLLISVECSTFESALEKVHVSVEPNRAQATTSGVGLALSGGLAQLMSGQMCIKSEEGGSCSMSVQFWVNT